MFLIDVEDIILKGLFNNMNDLKVGDYFSFDNINVLYRVLDIDFINGYFLYFDDDLKYTVWDRLDYIENVFKVEVIK